LLLRVVVLHRRRLVEVLVDFALTSAAFLAAYLLVVGGRGTIEQRHVFLVSLPVIVGARYAAFIPAGLYRGVWRFAGTREAAAIVAAVVVSEFVAYGIVAGWNGFGSFPQNVYVVDALLATVLVGASRFAERALFRALSALRGR